MKQNLFARAANNLPLTPEERALLKLVQGVIVTGLIAVIGVLTPLVASGKLEFTQQTLIAVAVAFFVAVLNAVAKLFSAKGDSLSSAVGTLLGDTAQVIQKNAPAYERADLVKLAADPRNVISVATSVATPVGATGVANK